MSNWCYGTIIALAMCLCKKLQLLVDELRQDFPDKHERAQRWPVKQCKQKFNHLWSTNHKLPRMVEILIRAKNIVKKLVHPAKSNSTHAAER